MENKQERKNEKQLVRTYRKAAKQQRKEREAAKQQERKNEKQLVRTYRKAAKQQRKQQRSTA